MMSPTEFLMIQEDKLSIYIYLERDEKEYDTADGTKCKMLLSLGKKKCKGISCTILSTFLEV